MTLRSALHWFHRYTGLVMALFLFLTSLTGMLLTFHKSLDDWFNRDYLLIDNELNSVAGHLSSPSQLSKQQPSHLTSDKQLPITELYRSVQLHYPQANFSSLPLEETPEHRAVSFRVDRQRGNAKLQPSVDFQTVYVNPYTAEIIGTRNQNEWAWRNTMNKIFWFHRNLLLGDIGQLILGFVALLWTINCFIGVYLTLPRAVKSNKTAKSYKAAKSKNQAGVNASRRKRSNYWKRWLSSWTIRRTKNIFKLSFDAHHALSLWLWVMMFVLAWSSVGFNLYTVYQPVMTAVFPDSTEDGIKKDRTSKKNKPVKKEKQQQVAANAGKQAAIIVTMSQIDQTKKTALKYANNKNVTIESFNIFNIDRQTGAQTIRFKTNLDTVGRGSSVTIRPSKIDMEKVDSSAINSNEKLGTDQALSSQQLLNTQTEIKWGFEQSTRDSVSMWLVYLHRGLVWGTPYKIFLAFVGLATAIVSATGVYLWWRGRKARLKKRARLNKKLG